ncbi:MAG: 30S ribosome-binding factor RbfA [Candidatus Muiribacteriota bacterium]
MKKESIRLKKINSLIKEITAKILKKEVTDPRLSKMTVINIKVAPDLREAKVFYSVLGGQEDKKEVKEALKKAGGFIQAKFSSEINLKYTPKLIFLFDDSVEKAQRMEEIFKKIKDDRND